jgi:aspartate/methionine/tyrosine aminotransferase
MAPSTLDRARELLGLLRDPATHEHGVTRARDLARATARGEETALTVRSVAIESLGELLVLTLPSIFAPEEWGRTFLRGLLARPLDAYRGKTVVELGSGSGWVSIALARFTPVAKIYALDLNPQAALVTEINALLAGNDAEGRPVAKKIEPGVSDLLSALEARDVTVDLVCGSIPQVLGPEEVARAEALTEDAEARVLRLLGDYTPPTGNYEDVLSLGLIANALERALPRLSPDGTIVLNLAGRPGFDVLRWVFARWGYAPRVLTKARIHQDPGTDISPFLRAETATGRAFSFYATREGRTAISAREAVARQKAGQDLFHDLYVVEGRPYRQLAAEGARRFLEDETRIPYTEDPGTELEGLREEASVYLGCYLRLQASPGEIFVAPSRGELVRAIALASTEPGDAVVLDAGLASVAGDLVHAGRDVRVAAASRIERAVEPGSRLVIASLGARSRPGAFGAARLRELVQACRASGALLVLDATYAAIASVKREPDELEALQDGLWRREDAILLLDLAEHLAIDRTASGYPLALGLVGPRYASLQRAAESTYSRAPLVPQVACRHLLATLNERYRGPRGSRAVPEPRPTAGRTSWLDGELARMPAFEPLPPASRRVLRLDFGESEHPVSERLRRGLGDGLAARDAARLALEAREAAASFLGRSRGLPAVDPASLVLGAGAQPLVAATIAAARELGHGKALVVLPRPFYGFFPAVILAAGAELAPVTASIDASGRFVLDEDEVRFRLDRAVGRPAVLLLAHPNNPTGCYHEERALERILALAAERGAIALLDEVFFALRHSPRGQAPVSALAIAARKPELARRLVVLEGLSKAFAAGGVRFGVAWVGDPSLRAALAAAAAAPSAGALGAARGQLREFESDLAAHTAWLGRRARRIGAVLGELGIESLEPEGGLFLAADLSPLEGRAWVGTDVWGHAPRERAPADDFRATLAQAAGLVVPPDHWSGWALPHRRLVFSIDDLDEALVRLRAFTTALERA